MTVEFLLIGQRILIGENRPVIAICSAPLPTGIVKALVGTILGARIIKQLTLLFTIIGCTGNKKSQIFSRFILQGKRNPSIMTSLFSMLILVRKYRIDPKAIIVMDVVVQKFL